MYRYFSLLIISLILVGCPLEDTLDYHIFLYNNSDRDISIIFSNGVHNTLIYPELLPPTISSEYCIRYIESRESFTFNSYIPFDEYIDSFPLDTIAVFVFDPDTLDAYPWEVIRDEYKVLKTHFITIDDVLKSDTIVIYP